MPALHLSGPHCGRCQGEGAGVCAIAPSHGQRLGDLRATPRGRTSQGTSLCPPWQRL